MPEIQNLVQHAEKITLSLALRVVVSSNSSMEFGAHIYIITSNTLFTNPTWTVSDTAAFIITESGLDQIKWEYLTHRHFALRYVQTRSKAMYILTVNFVLKSF